MFNLYTPTRVLFGAEQLNNLHKLDMPGKKAAVVISNGKSGLRFLPRLEEQMKLCGVVTVVFDKVESNPLKSTVEAGAAFIRENGCDFVIALGGGSVMDAAKVMALLAPNSGDLWDYVFGGTGKGLIGKNP
ncbi:MAG: iron-containing alcohol dehydrogenase, partial [Treponema sp.]|nr:iron-containing alcohol dehydrogenase [Treponema sp.]